MWGNVEEIVDQDFTMKLKTDNVNLVVLVAFHV